jgi:hypothetical protein
MSTPYNKSTHKKDVSAYKIDDDKFWSFVDIKGDDECWEWQKGKNTSGYGLFHVRNLPVDYERTGRSMTQLTAHRVAYSLTHPGIDAGLYVCHKCDNKSCCNPSHLWLGTQQENVDDMISKGWYARSGRDNFKGNAKHRISIGDMLK